MTAIMVPANLIITPLFTGWPVAAVKALIWPGIVPFNAIKAGINSIVSFLVFSAFAGKMK
jgi:riboflavin transporter FmnP